MRDIAADRDAEAVQPTLGAADRQRIQQRLRGMLMPPVARVEHGAVHLLRQQVYRARLRVAHDQQVGVHCVQRHRRVDQRFAFFDRAGLHCHVHHIRAQTLARDLETRLRSGGVLKKHVDLRQPAQRVRMLVRLAVSVGIGVGQIQQGGDVGLRELFDAKQVAMGE